MSSFSCILTLEGRQYPVVHCTYEFSQATRERGLTAAKVRSGLITLHLDVPDNDLLLAWAVDPHKQLGGLLIFRQTDRPIAGEILTFSDGFCVSYEEVFLAGSGNAGAYSCQLLISAGKLTLGATQKDNAWSETR